MDPDKLPTHDDLHGAPVRLSYHKVSYHIIDMPPPPPSHRASFAVSLSALVLFPFFILWTDVCYVFYRWVATCACSCPYRSTPDLTPPPLSPFRQLVPFFLSLYDRQMFAMFYQWIVTSACSCLYRSTPDLTPSLFPFPAAGSPPLASLTRAQRRYWTSIVSARRALRFRNRQQRGKRQRLACHRASAVRKTRAPA